MSARDAAPLIRCHPGTAILACADCAEDRERAAEQEDWQYQEQQHEQMRAQERAEHQHRERMEGEHRDTVLGERYRTARAHEREGRY